MKKLDQNTITMLQDKITSAVNTLMSPRTSITTKRNAAKVILENRLLVSPALVKIAKEYLDGPGNPPAAAPGLTNTDLEPHPVTVVQDEKVEASDFYLKNLFGALPKYLLFLVSVICILCAYFLSRFLFLLSLDFGKFYGFIFDLDFNGLYKFLTDWSLGGQEIYKNPGSGHDGNVGFSKSQIFKIKEINSTISELGKISDTLSPTQPTSHLVASGEWDAYQVQDTATEDGGSFKRVISHPAFIFATVVVVSFGIAYVVTHKEDVWACLESIYNTLGKPKGGGGASAPVIGNLLDPSVPSTPVTESLDINTVGSLTPKGPRVELLELPERSKSCPPHLTFDVSVEGRN
jgi:hypothetical protein